MTTKLYVKLEDEHFQALVKGQEVIIQERDIEVHLLLSDIGFDRMQMHLNSAIGPVKMASKEDQEKTRDWWV